MSNSSRDAIIKFVLLSHWPQSIGINLIVALIFSFKTLFIASSTLAWSGCGVPGYTSFTSYGFKSDVAAFVAAGAVLDAGAGVALAVVSVVLFEQPAKVSDAVNVRVRSARVLFFKAFIDGLPPFFLNYSYMLNQLNWYKPCFTIL
ncbi:hypothetical protein D3C85_1136640 [compost metagenome]